MNKSILIIDDEEHIRQMMRLVLEAAGYAVGEAHDGPEGLSLYGDGSSWDVVVLDQRMPGMDGLETLRRLKVSNPRARIVMATAYASIELAVDAMKLGASDFLRKPMTPETLRNSVAAALAKGTQEPASSERLAQRTQEPPAFPVIQTITMNGFSILDHDKDAAQLPDRRRFTVVSPAGTSYDVVVQIDEEAVGYVERLTRRRLPAESSFWTEQARGLLGDYLWNEGDIPPTRKLTVKELGSEKLQIAARWRDD
ncbi:MAG TPA: response regulator [Pyrinomonadaceae bacterium]|nr:response regulator [Pyrinomonadaceae bacterium]